MPTQSATQIGMLSSLLEKQRSKLRATRRSVVWAFKRQTRLKKCVRHLVSLHRTLHVHYLCYTCLSRSLRAFRTVSYAKCGPCLSARSLVFSVFQRGCTSLAQWILFGFFFLPWHCLNTCKSVTIEWLNTLFQTHWQRFMLVRSRKILPTQRTSFQSHISGPDS